MHRPTYLAHLTHVSSQSSKVKIMHKPAATDIALHKLIRNRWSPRAFSDKPVPSEVLRSLFEAARWAPSSNNEQPWAYLVATKDDPENFAKMVGVLVEFNANWANHAPVLALSVAHLKTQRDGKPNRVALHDVGSATAQFTFEANSRGLWVHQMAGFDTEKARQTFAIPADSCAVFWNFCCPTAMQFCWRGYSLNKSVCPCLRCPFSWQRALWLGA